MIIYKEIESGSLSAFLFRSDTSFSLIFLKDATGTIAGILCVDLENLSNFWDFVNHWFPTTLGIFLYSMISSWLVIKKKTIGVIRRVRLSDAVFNSYACLKSHLVFSRTVHAYRHFLPAFACMQCWDKVFPSIGFERLAIIKPKQAGTCGRGIRNEHMSNH